MNALGRPHLIASTVLVRETVQNSWDARLADDITVDFGLHVKVLSGGEFTALRGYILDSAPPALALRSSLEQESLPVLLISDRGTRGLAGATTADVRMGHSSDFADFFFNVGRTAQRAAGGGTYGFGKSVLYLASAAGSILVYTRCQTGEGYESRLMGAALGEDFTETRPSGSATFTGRHWWGTVSDDGAAVRPLTGPHADALAAALGFPIMSGTETGTTIMVLDFAPELDRSLMQISEDLGWAILWNCWPKSLPRRGRPAMTFSVRYESQLLPMPSVADVPVLHALARCMTALEGSPAPDITVHEIASAKPKQHLGRLALVTYRSTPADNVDATRSPIELPGHHVALMRSPELIVTYRPEAALDSAEVGWVGVFRADDGDVDKVFAACEPPTHDSWVVEQLERKHDRSSVRIALNRIRERVNDFVRPQVALSPAKRIPVGRIGDALAGLVALTSGPTPNPPPAPAPSPRRAPRARVVMEGPMRLARVNGVLTAVQRFTVHHTPGSGGTVVSARAGVVVQGGELERAAPAGSVTARVLRWESDDGETPDASRPLTTSVDDARYWEVTLLVPDDAMVALDLTAEATPVP